MKIIEDKYITEYNHWLDSPALSEAEWAELYAIKDDDAEKRARFYAPLEFGTAGLRGTMKTGLHNMNIHVIRHATQAFAEVIAAEGQDAMQNGIVIDYDCRHNSADFAKEAACVMAANGIHVRLFDALRPTPELSFAVRYYGTTAGLNITASHNPKEYNGYKVYWSDGAQLPPQQADAIAGLMAEHDIFTDVKTMDFDSAVSSGMIEYIGSEADEEFLKRALSQAINKKAVLDTADSLGIVYTPYHGCGYKLVPEALNRLGVRRLYTVPEQMIIDGDFPTVKSPNPENPEGFRLAVDLAKETGSSLIIGTDPDSDRICVLAPNKAGEYMAISGNQLGVLFLDYIIKTRKASGLLPENAGSVTSVVTTLMARAICEANNVHFEETFTGFKYLAGKASEWDASGEYSCIMAWEESCGYMVGDYVRDKDGVTMSVLAAEMAAYYCLQGMTLVDALDALYKEYGFFAEKTVNLVMPGLDGLDKMRAIMADLRKNHPDRIAGTEVARIRDYSDGVIYVNGLGMVGKTNVSGSNVLYFEMADDCAIAIRPSGTEPKIKIYLLVSGASPEACEERIQAYSGFCDMLVK